MATATRARPATSDRKAGTRTRKSSVKLFSRDTYDETDPQMRELKRYTSQQLNDPFDPLYSTGLQERTLLKPTYSPHALMRLPNDNPILRQCIDAYAVNIEGFGYRLEYVGEEGAEDSNEAMAEHNRLTSLLSQPNAEYSLIEMRQRVRRDLETLGYAYLEAGRDERNSVSLLYHAAAHTIRMTSRDVDPTMVNRVFFRDGKRVIKRIPMYFRRFVQQVGARTVYFKEFGDPRLIDPKTGQENNSLALEDAATEIYHISLYSPGDTYGLPRWINQLPSILGIRESELTNLQFFRDNAIPALAVLVAGGMLTEGAIENLENQFTAKRGRESMHRVLVIEATGDEDLAAENGTVPAPKLELKPLTDARQKDGMFKEYEEAGMVKIRSSFRLPPLFVGRTEDMTHATASASLSVAEGQVFGPERNKIDDVFNLHILAVDGQTPLYWQFRSLPPRITSAEDVIAAIDKFDVVGAMTPNIAIGLANELFDLNIETIADDWGNFPIEFSKVLMDKDALAGVEKLYSQVYLDKQKKVEDAKAKALEQGQVDSFGNPVKPVDTATPAKAKTTTKSVNVGALTTRHRARPTRKAA